MYILLSYLGFTLELVFNWRVSGECQECQENASAFFFAVVSNKNPTKTANDLSEKITQGMMNFSPNKAWKRTTFSHSVCLDLEVH